MINNKNSFQNILDKLKSFWIKNVNSIRIESYDIEVGAGTSHPMTFLWSLKDIPISFIYIQKSRRPCDSIKNNINFDRLYSHFQFQVIIRPIPNNIQELYIKSLKYIGINLKIHDIKFIEDNWENTTLSSWGIGWEVQLDTVEITQFTYFQQVGGINCKPIIEITYGLERILMFIQNLNNIYELIWDINKSGKCIKYKDIFYYNEIEYSLYNYKYSNINLIFNRFIEYKNEAEYLLINSPLIIPTYEAILKSIHNFNILDSKKIFSFFEKEFYILEIQKLSKKLANKYVNNINF
ncbi:glycine--tRNA ligase alpha subunit [endosymbiont of Sipalinus gigas]|uniref:glycine--tRNA ligase subunit alpha n=1 Tax=endosymbiont of Sipalinus gigas TaxID=1972134 RepID=UPI000DC73EE5|nr:glycine--tRNA ligase subunit alpha [endosymbiont of Sipalinus gigas]BBA85224.1 glycine--tRNA ligase alpha subunit [endosymbiont of Sipalinus gigas]